MKKLLVLGGSRYVIPVIEKAHELGVYVITCDYLPNNVAHQYSDEYHNVSIVDKSQVLQLAKRLNIDGILSFATDPGVEVAAYVADQLGLTFCPYESVKILQNKDLFRDFLEKNGFNVPKHRGFSEDDNWIEQIKNFEFPLIVKPVDSAGSKGVTKVDSFTQINEAVNYALEYSLSNRFIIEEFIEQKGHSSDSDCFSINNQLVSASFSCQSFDKNANNPFTPSAYSWPSDMSQDALDELRSELQRLIQLLNLGTSIYNVETRVGQNNKPYIMEVSPRGGGNRLSELVRMASGVDMIENNIRGALNMDLIPMNDPIYSGAWAEYILHSNKAGSFKEVHISDKLKEHVIEIDLWVKVGDRIKEFTGANQAIGTLVLKFENQENLHKALEEIDNNVFIVVDEIEY